MKIIAAAILAASLLVGCGNSATPTTAPATAPAATFRASAAAACKIARAWDRTNRETHPNIEDNRADRDAVTRDLDAITARYAAITPPPADSKTWNDYIDATRTFAADIHTALYGPPDVGSVLMAASTAANARTLQAQAARALNLPDCIPTTT